jgi:hypothetical protein
LVYHDAERLDLLGELLARLDSLRSMVDTLFGQYAPALSLFLRSAALLVAATVALKFAFGIVSGIIRGLAEIALLILRLAARNLDFGFMELAASGYVALESSLYRMRIVPLPYRPSAADVTEEYEDEDYDDDEDYGEEEKEVTDFDSGRIERPSSTENDETGLVEDQDATDLTPPSQSFTAGPRILRTPLSYIWTPVVGLLLFFTLLPFGIVLSLFAVCFRPTWPKFLALIAAVWYFFNPRSLPSLQLPNVQLSTVIAALTLVVLVFALANSDIRGRAELNKVASVECRLMLHRSVRPLLRMSEAMEAHAAARFDRFADFPTRETAQLLLGRVDLVWIENRVYFSDAAARKNPLGFQVKELAGERDFDREKDEEQHQSISNGYLGVMADLDSVFEKGFGTKLDRVSNRAAFSYLSRLYRDFDLPPEGTSPCNTDLLREHLGDRSLEELMASWTRDLSRSPSNPPTSGANQRILRDLIGHARSAARSEMRVCWDELVGARRARYVANYADDSLSPSLLERLRQFFGK